MRRLATRTRPPGVRAGLPPAGAAWATALVAAVLAALASAPLPLRAQEPEAASAYVRAQITVDTALAVQRRGEFSDAYAMLRDGAVACDTAAVDASRCRDLVYFSLGYLLQREAARDPDPDLLGRAIDYYERVGGVAAGTPPPDADPDPVTADAVYNLALLYRTLGPREWQESRYRAAPQFDPQRQALHYAFLGDYYAQTARWREALDAYRSAASADPDAEAPRVGMLDVYRRLGEQAAGELLTLAEDWEPRFPELAARGYETVIATTFRDSPQLAEHALVRYVRVLARGRGIDAGALARLPADWPPVRALAGYLAYPDTPATVPWWLETEERSRALAQVALAVGRRQATQGRPEDAERSWRAAQALVDATRAEALDLKRELALLYVRHPSLDPDGVKFDRLEREFFEEKGVVLAARDLEASQRYHSILGQIYFERGVWRSAASGWNAIDQLTWALRAAERRNAEHRFHQPLPELHSLLAASYEAIGNVRAARAQHEHAARAFLDVDDIEAAASATARAVEPGRTSPLSVLIDHRARLEAVRGPTPQVVALCQPNAIDRVLRAAGHAGTSFGVRQRFKILADCLEARPADRRAAYGAEAMILAVESEVPLVGIADVLRLENAIAAVRERADIVDFEAHIDFQPHAEGAELRAALVTDTRPAYVMVPEDAVIGARVVQLIGNRPDPYRIRVREGAVIFQQDPTRLQTPQLTDAIVEVPGVRTVRGTRPPP